MEANGMTMGDFVALEKVGNRHRGVANSALGLGIAGLAVGLVGLWGVNAASQARSRAAENANAATQLALQQAINNGNEANRLLTTLLGTERASRENWQSQNQPTISQTLSLQNNPSLQSTVQDIVTAMAAARAEANNNGINSAVGSDPFLRVQMYSAPQPCGCPCNG